MGYSKPPVTARATYTFAAEQLSGCNTAHTALQAQQVGGSDARLSEVAACYATGIRRRGIPSAATSKTRGIGSPVVLKVNCSWPAA